MMIERTILPLEMPLIPQINRGPIYRALIPIYREKCFLPEMLFSREDNFFPAIFPGWLSGENDILCILTLKDAFQVGSIPPDKSG